MISRFGLLFLCIVIIELFGHVAHARVFTMTDENFATYLSFNGGTSNIGKNAFTKESVATDYNNSQTTDVGGEVGFLYARQWFSLKFGFEILRPLKLDDVVADQSGTPVYHMSSEILGYAPKVGAEISVLRMGIHRVYLAGAVGMATINITNNYTNLTIAPHADHSVEMKGTGNIVQGGIGYEIYLLERTTFIFEANYRSLKVDNFTHTKAVTTFTGNTTVGQDVFRTDNARRELDFTGMFATVGFRIWL